MTDASPDFTIPEIQGPDLLDALTDVAIYMLDAHGVVKTWTRGAENLKGYAPADIVGRHYSCFFTTEDKAAGLPERNLENARNAPYESEGWRLRKDGSRFWAGVVIHPLKGPAGQLIGYAKITRDLTERKTAKDALQASERRFRLLVEGVVDYAIYMLDPRGIVTNWNQGAQRMKGYTADEIIGQHFSRFYPPDDRAAGMPARVLESAMRDGRYEAEGWRLRKDGSRFWASVVVDVIKDEQGKLLGFAKITRDITERRAAQQALFDSERRFRLLVEGVTDYALYMLDPNGIVTNWNTGAERIKGYTADEVIGQHFAKFFTEEDRSRGLPFKALQTAMVEGRFESEGWRVRKDGTRFWANAIIDAIKDESGTLLGFAKITRDITERRQAQIALDKAQAQRNQAQKMEALGQLTGGVAHDFNNLLMIVSGHLRTLKALAGDNPKGARAVMAVETAVQRGSALTRQLLTFSRRQTLNAVTVELQERIGMLETMLSSALSGSAALATDISPDIWPVKIDVSEFELALVNLTFNARDALGKGGFITIMAENVLDIDDLPGEFVAITVTDNGSGIAPDILPKVFDPFFTTKQADNKGSGLGLSQVYGFAHQSGGTVKIRSELGKGTQVTMYLPRAAAGVQPTDDQELEIAGNGTVLLVEDNPDVMEVTVDTLEQLGYRVQTAPTAEKALQVLQDQTFTLIVSDIVMAGAMNGLEFARKIRGVDKDLPIVLVTGYSDSAMSAESDFVVLRKPYQSSDLSRAIAKAIAKTNPPENLIDFPDVRHNRPT